MELINQIGRQPACQTGDEESGLQRPLRKRTGSVLFAARSRSTDVLLDVRGLDLRHAIAIRGHQVPFVANFVVQTKNSKVFVRGVRLGCREVRGPQAVTTRKIVGQRHNVPGCGYGRTNVNARSGRPGRTARETGVKSAARNHLVGVRVASECARIDGRNRVQVVRYDVPGSWILEFKDPSTQGCGWDQARKHCLREEMTLFLVKKEKGPILPNRSADLASVAVIAPFWIFNWSFRRIPKTIVAEPIVRI